MLFRSERPIVKGNLFVSNKIDTTFTSQHIVPFRETDNNKLLQLKLYMLFHLNFISTWVALLISYLAYIRSKMRHVCSNYFGFKNIKPSLKSLEKAGVGIMTYLKHRRKSAKGKA